MPPLSPQVFHLSQAKQDVATGVLVCHQHRCQQRLHPVQNVRRLPREEIQPSTIWRETRQGVAGPGGHITSPLRLCWPRGGGDKEVACHLPAHRRAHVWSGVTCGQGSRVVRVSCGQGHMWSPLQRVAPWSLMQLTGGAVTSEGTSNRISGLCSAFQSLKDYDRLTCGPDKLIHAAHGRAWVSSTPPCDRLRCSTQCGAIKTQRQQGRNGCGLLAIDWCPVYVLLRGAGGGAGQRGPREEGRAMLFFYFSIYLQVIFLLLLKVYRK